MKSPLVQDVTSRIFLHAPLEKELQNHTENCIECGLCVKECAFLQKHGTPGAIATAFNLEQLPTAFECSLCGLCASVCPPKVGLNPAALFLEMRREAVACGAQDLSDYGGLLNYEKTGTSGRYSYYALPENCDTVLFPGCTLPGTRPDKVKALFDHLLHTTPTLGIVLDCCTKPSHDLGRDKHFHAMFSEMNTYLIEHGVKNILVACPNCYRVFRQYGEGLSVKTVYEYLLETSLPATPDIPGQVTIHDPCGTRNEKQVHGAVRGIVEKKSLQVNEMQHQGTRTICCGEGGTVACVNPAFASNWGKRRAEEAGQTRIITYCAGCVNFLGLATPTSHVLDLLFEPEATLSGKVKVHKAPFTYLNRLRLKKYFKKNIDAQTSRVRTVTGENKGKGGFWKRIVALAVLLGVLLMVHFSGVTQYLEQEKLRDFIEGYGILAPLIYMLTYTLAPALFLPGLPITIVGGILFGPFWGVVYSITGATAGACLAFLVSRHIGRGWIEQKLKSSKWRQLDSMVEQHGWKTVAFTRLIPVFPFNLLNYAFGLTRVKFTHYAVASFVFMLPACIAFIVFSSSLLEVLRGNITPSFIIGILLIAGVSSIPFFYKKRKSGNVENEKVPDKIDESGTTDSGRARRGVFRKKCITLLVMLTVGITVSLLVSHYFYYLDAYFYTLEFYWQFNVNNLQTANVTMFTEFFKPMGIGNEALPQVIISNLIQNFYLPFSKPVLVSSVTAAFGMGIGLLFSFIGIVLVGMVSYGLGSFFFGDIVPAIKKNRLENYQKSIGRPAAIIVPLLFTVPVIPVSLIAISSAAMNISFRKTVQYMLVGLALRIGWLLTMPSLFL